MKKWIMYVKVNLGKILLILVMVSVLVLASVFCFYSFKNFFALEAFTQRMIAGQMALMAPMFLLVQLLSLPFIFGMQYFLINGMGLTRKMDIAKVKVHWDEVIGMENAKREAQEIVKLLKDRHMLKKVGGRIIKGTIMFGPPGCGKTYLAKAIATECGLPLLSATGSDFMGIYVGTGTAQMKRLFKQARELAKIEGGCLIFIDEIDAFARPRQGSMGVNAAVKMDFNATINQFLTEMDGLRQIENNIVIFAATNVGEHELDSALMRAGRFDRKIYVTRPNLGERKQVFDFYLKKIQKDVTVDSGILAQRALGFSPADIESMVREAGLIATRYNRDTITMKDLSEAYDRVTFGMKSNITMNLKEKTWTAYHEAGHALIGYILHPTDDVIKATIIPRKGMLGMVARRPTEELYSSTKEELLADIKVMIAAYVAEKIKFGSTSAGVGGGAGSDFDQAMRTAYYMVWSYGMGQSGLMGDFQSLDQNYNFHISEKTKETLDKDVQIILQSCMQEVESILTEKRELLEYFAQELLKKEELEYDEIRAIFDQFGVKPLRTIPHSS